MKVLKFGAVWCTGCIVMKPRWQDLEKQNSWIKTEYYDYDEREDLVKKYKVGDKIPVFIWLDKKGNELERKVGEYKKEELLEICQKYKDK